LQILPLVIAGPADETEPFSPLPPALSSPGYLRRSISLPVRVLSDPKLPSKRPGGHDPQTTPKPPATLVDPESKVYLHTHAHLHLHTRHRPPCARSVGLAFSAKAVTPVPLRRAYFGSSPSWGACCASATWTGSSWHRTRGM
jgi:hypothetical protein